MNGVKEHWLTSSAHLSVQHGCVLDAHSGPSKFRVCSWQFSLSQGPLKAMGWMATPVFRETLAMIFNEILWMVAKSKSPVVRWFIILYHTISYYIPLLISMTMLGLQSSASDSEFAATVSHNIPQCQEIRTSTGPTMPTWEPLLSLTSRLDATCPVEAESLSRVLHGAHT